MDNNREPQQICIGVNTEYRANLVKDGVNVPVTLHHMYWVCQFNPFFISAGRGLLNRPTFTAWNIIGGIIIKFPTAIPYLIVLY